MSKKIAVTMKIISNKRNSRALIVTDCDLLLKTGN